MFCNEKCIIVWSQPIVKYSLVNHKYYDLIVALVSKTSIFIGLARYRFFL